MASGVIEKKFHGGSTGGYYFGIQWSATADASTNSSSVTAKVFIKSSGNGYTINSSATKNITLSIMRIMKQQKIMIFGNKLF